MCFQNKYLLVAFSIFLLVSNSSWSDEYRNSNDQSDFEQKKSNEVFKKGLYKIHSPSLLLNADNSEEQDTSIVQDVWNELPEEKFVENSNRLRPRIEGNIRYSNDRTIGMTELWLPLAQTDDSVFYADLRLMIDNLDNDEGNIGLGYRKIYAPLNGVLGGHVWFDRRFTDLGSRFNQITVGGEYLGEKFDILVNGYVPLSDSNRIQTTNLNSNGPQLVGTNILVDTNSITLEEPQHGVDAEFGWQLPFLIDYTDSNRVYAGGYYFNGNDTDEVAGWRTRFASDITQNFQVGARFQNDNERGSQTFLEATVRFPFNNKKSFRKNGLYARLDDSPERDIDIVTSDEVVDTGENVTVLNIETGQAQEVLHVDNSAAGGGDGSVENPFNTLADAEAAASAHTVIYVNSGTGTTLNQDQGITLDEQGQQLIGSGTNFVFDAGRFRASNGLAPTQTLIQAATSAPVITNAAVNGNAVSIDASDVSVSGVELNGAQGNNINISADAESFDNISISDVTSTGSMFSGLYAEAINGGNISNISITNSDFDTSGNTGIYITANTNGTVQNTTINQVTSNNNMDDGIQINADTNGSFTGSVDISDNTTNTNDNVGIRVSLQGNATLENLSVTNNTVDDNDDQGIYLDIDQSDVSNTTITNNDVSSSGLSGIHIAGTTLSTIDNTVIQGNTSNNNERNGVYVFGNSGVTYNNVTINDNTASSNSGAGDEKGIYVNIDSDANISELNNAVITNNTTNGNNDEGIYVYGNDGSRMNGVTISNNETNNNIQDGIYVRANDGAQFNNQTLVSNNTIDNNQDKGIQVVVETNAYMEDLDIISNDVTQSGEEGLLLFARTTSDIDNATINGNTFDGSGDQGAYVNVISASTVDVLNVTNNEFTNNSDHGLNLRTFNGGSDIGMAVINGNTMSGNANDGLVIETGSAGAMTAEVSSNTMINNGGYGVNVDRDSSGTFNVDLGGGALSSAGRNRIFNNTTNDIFVDLDVSGVGGTLQAQNNYWGNPAGLLPGRQDLDVNTAINSVPFLTTDPN